METTSCSIDHPRPRLGPQMGFAGEAGQDAYTAGNDRPPVTDVVVHAEAQRVVDDPGEDETNPVWRRKGGAPPVPCGLQKVVECSWQSHYLRSAAASICVAGEDPEEKMRTAVVGGAVPA